MSTGADCCFVEKEPSVWYYSLQEYPYGDTDDYTEYGPFYSLKSAERHLDKNHANPGAYSIDYHPDSTEEQEE